MKILLAAATKGEIEPTLAWLRQHAIATDENRFSLGPISMQLCLTGVGIMATTEALTRALLATKFGFAVQAGVAGAFDRRITLGEVVRVQWERLGDLGVEERDGTFTDVFELGLAGLNSPPFVDGAIRYCGDSHPLITPFASLRHVSGLTVQTVSGAEATIASRMHRFGADIETMEGAPFQYCCAQATPMVPFVQIRAISNYVEPRNRAAWKMPEAIAALNATLISAMELWTRAPRTTP